MSYQIIGENQNGSVTVRMFIGSKIIDEVVVLDDPEQTKEDRVKSYIDPRMEDFKDSNKLDEALSNNEVFDVLKPADGGLII